MWKAIEAESQKTDGSFPDESEDPVFHNMKTYYEEVIREVNGFHTGKRQSKRSAAQQLISAYIKHVFKQSRFVRRRKFTNNMMTIDGSFLTRCLWLQRTLHQWMEHHLPSRSQNQSPGPGQSGHPHRRQAVRRQSCS